MKSPPATHEDHVNEERILLNFNNENLGSTHDYKMWNIAVYVDTRYGLEMYLWIK